MKALNSYVNAKSEQKEITKTKLSATGSGGNGSEGRKNEEYFLGGFLQMEEMKKADFRVEKDSIGKKNVPENVYYGVQSLRAAENFHITGLNMHPEIINSLAYIKKASAITNCEVGLLEKEKPMPSCRLVMKSSRANSMSSLS